jgi:hypothetical protein
MMYLETGYILSNVGPPQNMKSFDRVNIPPSSAMRSISERNAPTEYAKKFTRQP